MSGFLTKQYELLAGPYRTALWGILCRFKTRFVANIANDFCTLREARPQQKDAIDQALLAYSLAYERFLQSRDDFKRTLSGSIDDFKIELDSKALSEMRAFEIQQYFKRTLEKWRVLAERWSALAKRSSTKIADSDRDSLFEVISESLWPYYGVVYKVKNRSDKALSDYNFATWIQKTDLLSQPFLSRIGTSSDGLSGQILYPTMSRHPEHNAPMRTILKVASDTFQDFDEPSPDDPVGLVQMLPKTFIRKGFKRYLWIEKHLNENRRCQQLRRKSLMSAGRFTDLFFFNNDVIRSVIREVNQKESISQINDDGQDDKGILFLAAANIDTLCHLIDIRKRIATSVWSSRKDSLRRRMHEAWFEAGGSAFSIDFHDHVVNLRQKLLDDMSASELPSIRAEQGAAWAHDVKNWTGPIIRDLGSASVGLRELRLPEDSLSALRRAEFNSRLLNIVAIGRQYIFEDLAQRAERKSAHTIFLHGRDPADIRFIIESAVQLLLTLHSGTYRKEFTVNWCPQWGESEIFDRMELILEDGSKRRIYAAIVAFLREVVHNIKLDENKRVTGHDIISVRYEVGLSGNNIILSVHQEHIQTERRRGRMPPGLKKANMLYGPDGARLGHIPENSIKLQNEEIEINQIGEANQSVRIIYDLVVEFFI
jgi:hypothetical protein